MFFFLDHNKNVIKWGYEVLRIPYKHALDKNNKYHDYVTDFYLELLDRNGKLQKYIVEIKPKKQLVRPNPPKNRNRKAVKRYLFEMSMYIRNKCKWKYAEAFCKRNGLIFKVLTEDTLP